MEGFVDTLLNVVFINSKLAYKFLRALQWERVYALFIEPNHISEIISCSRFVNTFLSYWLHYDISSWYFCLVIWLKSTVISITNTVCSDKWLWFRCKGNYMWFKFDSISQFMINVLKYINEFRRVFVTRNVVEVQSNEIAFLSAFFHLEKYSYLLLVTFWICKFKRIILIDVLRIQNGNIMSAFL